MRRADRTDYIVHCIEESGAMYREDAENFLRKHDMEQQEALPHRFSASPAEVDRFLRTILAEDTYLDYQRAIGNAAVHEAAGEIRLRADELDLTGRLRRMMIGGADLVDPAQGGGHYPAVLLCSRHDGFGPCPGAPRCTPRADEIGGGRGE